MKPDTKDLIEMVLMCCGLILFGFVALALVLAFYGAILGGIAAACVIVFKAVVGLFA